MDRFRPVAPDLRRRRNGSLGSTSSLFRTFAVASPSYCTQSGRRDAIGVAENYSPPNPALKHTRTNSQSESESLPINRASRCDRVTGNSLKYGAARSPACFQSRNAQSVGASGFGACVVIRPTTTSGLCRWYSYVESTTAGRVFVTCAPGNAPTTTSPGFNGFPAPDLQSAAQRPPPHRRDPRPSRNRTTRSCARPQDQPVGEPNSGPSQLLPAEGPGPRRLAILPVR